MATKSMPRIRAGASGSPVVTSTKRSVQMHGKSKPQDTFNHNKRFSPVSIVEDSSIDDSKYSNSISNSATVHDMPGTSISTDLLNDHVSDTVATSDTVTWNKGTSDEVDVNCSTTNLGGSNDSNLNVNHLSNSLDPLAEISRLRQLSMLQVSLISRQQDLLKIRDKEILQLKSAKQSYKSRLERMERRISLSRRHNESHNSNSKPQETVKTETPSDIETNSNKIAMSHDTNETIDHCESENLGSIHSQADTKNLTDNSGHACNNKQLLSPSDAKNRVSSTDNSVAPTFVSSLPSPVSLMQAAYSAGGRVPVPLSFIDRCHNQLTMTASPTSKNAPPLTSRDSMDSPYSLTVKICNHCPHCATLAEEVKSSLPLEAILDRSEITSKGESKPSCSSASGDVPRGQQLMTEGENLNQTFDCMPMRSKYPYYRHTWLQDEHLYRFTDLDSNVEKQTGLNIPTWRVNEIPHHTLDIDSQRTDLQEATDDEAYLKRHNRLEISEKRRKRWDIQRIREYRYNEKLRLKLDKHRNITNDTIETFAPSLTNIIAVEVQDTLPVNIFGYPLMSLKPEQFSLPADF